MIQFVIDMNLSPRWAVALADAGWHAVHWIHTGDPSEEDENISRWAVDNGFVVLTQDLDFGELLALTNASAPSTVLLRTKAIRVEQLAERLIPILREAEESLQAGALLVVANGRERLRLLPLNREH
jgi:predicted nuclease of predicted toxin-antitoxin system